MRASTPEFFLKKAAPVLIILYLIIFVRNLRVGFYLNAVHTEATVIGFNKETPQVGHVVYEYRLAEKIYRGQSFNLLSLSDPRLRNGSIVKIVYNAREPSACMLETEFEGNYDPSVFAIPLFLIGITFIYWYATRPRRIAQARSALHSSEYLVPEQKLVEHHPSDKNEFPEVLDADEDPEGPHE